MKKIILSASCTFALFTSSYAEEIHISENYRDHYCKEIETIYYDNPSNFKSDLLEGLKAKASKLGANSILRVDYAKGNLGGNTVRGVAANCDISKSPEFFQKSPSKNPEYINRYVNNENFFFGVNTTIKTADLLMYDNYWKSATIVDIGFRYTLYQPNYVVGLNYSIVPEQKILSMTRPNTTAEYDLMIKGRSYGASYLYKFYQASDIYVAPVFNLSHYAVKSHLQRKSGFDLNDIVIANNTDKDLSLNIMLAREYKQYSTIYTTLSLSDDIFFKDLDKEKDYSTLSIGVEHSLGEKLRVTGSIAKDLKDSDVVKNAESFSIGLDYKF